MRKRTWELILGQNPCELILGQNQQVQLSEVSQGGWNLKRLLIREDLNVIQYQSQEADNTFITSDGTSPNNSTR